MIVVDFDDDVKTLDKGRRHQTYFSLVSSSEMELPARERCINIFVTSFCVDAKIFFKILIDIHCHPPPPPHSPHPSHPNP